MIPMTLHRTPPAATGRSSRRRLRHGAVILGLGLALMAPSGAAFAASDDDAAAPEGSMVIAVVIPDHAVAPVPVATPAAPDGAAVIDRLPGTGVDAAGLWPYALAGLAAALTGTAIVTTRRRRPS
jgi:hypothetical protein